MTVILEPTSTLTCNVCHSSEKTEHSNIAGAVLCRTCRDLVSRYPAYLEWVTRKLQGSAALCWSCGAVTQLDLPCPECGETRQIPVTPEYAATCRDYPV